MGARETALNALIACRKEAAWSNGVLKEYIVRDRLDRRDAALAAKLCYGVLQNRNKLDFYLKQLLTGKLKDLHPVVHDILHLGLYQIYELDKVPDNAAVSESVDLAKKYCKKQRFAPGLVNGVLRSAVKTKGTSSLCLTDINGLDTCTNDLTNVCSGVYTTCNQYTCELAEL